jgi:hypothetical protein
MIPDHFEGRADLVKAGGQTLLSACDASGIRVLQSGVTSPDRGPVAQLGARMNGIHEVTGSIPVWSTNSFFSSDTELK